MSAPLNTPCPECGRAKQSGALGEICPSCLLRFDEVEEVAPGVSMLDETIAAEDTGLQISRYRLLERIGEGGYGMVWMAEQKEPVRRRVALKVIKLGMDTKQVVARFEAERQALALMDHQNIARVFDGGGTDTGRPYFVMELVQGLPLTQYCDKTKLNLRERIELLVQVCQAVQHAHQKGIIHRDLKPTNVLVTEQDGKPLPKVIDFGIAKATDVELTDKTLFTRFNQMIGTPAYMSPEQAGLGSLDIDTRADIYSLGVLLYELLTGRTPLDPKQSRSANYEAVLKSIREVEAPRPSTCLSALTSEDLTQAANQRREEPERLVRSLHGDLDWIALKALEKDRARRYASAQDLAADLQRFLNNEPIVARPPSNLYRLQKAWRRNRLVFSAGLMVAAAVLAGLAISLWMYFREAHANRAAEASSQGMREALYASEMNVAYHSWQEGNVVQARDLLDKQRPASGNSQSDLRGFDWRYLWRVSRPLENFTLTNAANWGIGVSADGRWVAGVYNPFGEYGNDGALCLWSLEERRAVATLSTNSVWAFAAAFSPDGRMLAVPGTECVQLWDLNSRTKFKELPTMPGRKIIGLAFSPDGRYLAATCGRVYTTNLTAEIRLWDAGTGSLVTTCILSQWAYQIAFSPDGKLLAVAGGDGVARLFSIPECALVAQLPEGNGFLGAVAFSHDGRVLATGDEKGYVRLWDWERRDLKYTFKAHNAQIYGIALAPHDHRLVTASRDFTARMWDRYSGEPLALFAGHSSGVTKAFFLPDGETLVTASQVGEVKVWDTRRTVPASLEVPTADCSKPTPQFISGGRALVWLNPETKKAVVLDPTTRNVLKEMPANELASSPDGSQLAVLHESRVTFLDPITFEQTGLVECGSAIGGRPSFSPDGRWLAFRRGDSAREDANTQVVIIDVGRRKVMEELDTDLDGKDGWAPVFFARDGKILITTRWRTQQFRVWDTSNWKVVDKFEGPRAQYSVSAISADGTKLAMAGYGGLIRTWDLERMEELAPIHVGASVVHSIAFDPDGRCLAAGMITGAVKLWSQVTQQEIATLRGHGSLVSQLEFSPDGCYLASGSFDRSIRLWHAPSWSEIQAAESAPQSNLPITSNGSEP